jgi:hypothetical protein
MTQPNRTQSQEAVVQGVLTVLLPELLALQESGRERAEQMARIDERQTQMADVLEKITECMYGNGKPGLKADLEEVTRKVADVEALHQTEKEARLKTEQDHDEAKKAEVSEWRKFKWGILAAVVMAGLDLAFRLLGWK